MSDFIFRPPANPPNQRRFVPCLTFWVLSDMLISSLSNGCGLKISLVGRPQSGAQRLRLFFFCA
nr:MAG TPA: hypothetical protein [Caudoviricetes sp.]